MNSDAFHRIIEAVRASVSRKEVEEYQSLLYNDLREIIVSGDEISPLMLRAIREIPVLSQDHGFTEAYLGAFAYYYKFEIRKRVGIFSPPAEFGLNYDFTQQFFRDFLKLLRLKVGQCAARHQIYYSAIINAPTASLAHALSIIGDPSKPRAQKKNAAILLCHAVWRRSDLIKLVPDLSDLNLGSKRVRAIADLYLGRLDFESARAVVREGGSEDRELDWCQSFISVVAALGILFSFPGERAIDFIFDEIDRLRGLPLSRGYELECDAYKCLNEDSALIISRWLMRKSAKWQHLMDYFLLQARSFGLQSHELLRKGLLVADTVPVMDRKRIRIYDYQTEIA